jgi:ubiquitin-protein ligase
LKLVLGLLPSLDRESSFDLEPPGTVTGILLASRILTCCAELLRNDSLEDASKRHGLYNDLLSFLDTASLHPSTAGVVFNERPVRPDKVNILTLSFQNPASVVTETVASLYDGLRNLTTQSNLLLHAARAHEKEFKNAEGQNLLSLCRRISELSQVLDANDPRKTKKTMALSNESITISVTDLPQNELLSTHAFAQQARNMQTARPGRMKRLITEITTLNTGLPPGIFVRYGSDRPDVLKVVIIGPCGTPYENGMFEFDFFCCGAYPQQPPQVSFKTTGGGRAAFNPNLYPCGKVCLSLLGTWQGEPWNPGESTLLQVLISLQALILCEEPWYNEPGRENARRPGQENLSSTAYNHHVRKLTVRHAMLGWLEKPPLLWKDVVVQHFKQNGNEILETVSKWSTENKPVTARDYSDYEDGIMPMPYPGGGSTDMSDMLPQLQTELHKYGATVVVPKPSETLNSKMKAPRTPIFSPFSGFGASQLPSVPPHNTPFANPYSVIPPPPSNFAFPSGTWPSYSQPPPLGVPQSPTTVPQPPLHMPQPAPSTWEPVFGSPTTHNAGHSPNRGRGSGTRGVGTDPSSRGGYHPSSASGGRGGSIAAYPTGALLSSLGSPPSGSDSNATPHDRASGFLNGLELRMRGGSKGRGNRGSRGGSRGGRGASAWW